ncbi:MAG: cytochrome c peroxidase [Woeseiaceae bacterium]
MSNRPLLFAGIVAAVMVVFTACQSRDAKTDDWTEQEVAVLRSLSLDSLQALPPDRSNAVADEAPARQFGERLFFEPRLSVNNGISCATCHQPIRHFSDGLPKGQAIGTSERNTPSIIGTAYSPWMYWDGRRDSQWSQALSPLEDPNEQASNRIQIVRQIANDQSYREQYEALFGTLPAIDDRERFPDIAGAAVGEEWRAAWSSMTEEDRRAVNRAFSNIGKAIAAFERSIVPSASRFDKYVAGLSGNDPAATTLLNTDEMFGLRLFIGKANCTQCHNGPLLTNHEFHNTGVLSSPGELPDIGRAAGVREVIENPFNCGGDYSDDPERRCSELEFVRTGPELIGAVRTPSLRNVEFTAPYMHKGQIATLAEVLLHYNEAPDSMIGHNEAKPLDLSGRELRQLEAFLRTLGGHADSYQSESM